MAVDLDDCEFWLPPQFLTDDDLLMDFKSTSVGFNPNLLSPHLDLSSPVESVVGSTETESDEDDYITGLTRKMAHSTFLDSGFGYENTKGWSLSGSPQSTLCGCKQGSSRGSPNCPSQDSSPPRMKHIEVSMDLLYAAAGEVARMRMIEGGGAGLYHNKAGIWAPPRKTSPVPVAPNKPSLGSFSSNQPQISYQQLQIAQFQRLKQQQMMKQGGFTQYTLSQNQQQLTESRARNGVTGPLNWSNSAWPTLQQSQQLQQQQQSSGMRAVFLPSPGPKRECAGTGVFLPRRIGTQTETRKKPGCPVLLPDRVVQALNLNLEAVDARPQPQVQARAADGVLKYRNNVAAAAQRRRNARTQAVAMSQELLLPQEWTY